MITIEFPRHLRILHGFPVNICSVGMHNFKKSLISLCGFAAHELHESRKFILQYNCDISLSDKVA